jgi:hypothetical protein
MRRFTALRRLTIRMRRPDLRKAEILRVIRHPAAGPGPTVTPYARLADPALPPEGTPSTNGVMFRDTRGRGRLPAGMNPHNPPEALVEVAGAYLSGKIASADNADVYEVQVHVVPQIPDRDPSPRGRSAQLRQPSPRGRISRAWATRAGRAVATSRTAPRSPRPTRSGSPAPPPSCRCCTTPATARPWTPDGGPGPPPRSAGPCANTTAPAAASRLTGG